MAICKGCLEERKIINIGDGVNVLNLIIDFIYQNILRMVWDIRVYIWGGRETYESGRLKHIKAIKLKNVQNVLKGARMGALK